MSISMSTLLATVAILYAAYRIVLRYLTPKPLPGIPHYKPVGAFGDIPRMASYLRKDRRRINIDFFGQIANDLGPIAQMFFLNKPAVVLSDYQEMEDIMLRRTREFDRSSLTVEMFSTLFPKAMLSLLTDTTFKNHRRYLFPSQSSTNLTRVAPQMGSSAQHLCRIWEAKRKLLQDPGQGQKCFKVDDDLALCAWDIIGQTTLAEDFHGLDDLDGHLRILRSRVEGKNHMHRRPLVQADFVPPRSELLHAHEILLTHLARAVISPSPGLYGYYQNLLPSWRRAYKFMFEYMRRKVERARATESLEAVGDCTLAMVIDTERQGVGQRLEMKELCDELYMLLIGGSETTQTTVRWALKFLARSPSVQFKLRQHLLDADIPDAFEGRLPSFSDLTSDKVSYLEAVAWEALRLGRTSGGNVREATIDTEVLGHFIPKGTPIIFAAAHVATTETLSTKAKAEALDSVRSTSSARTCGFWDDETVGDFRPERYLTETGQFDLKKGPNLVFGTGIRGCFGQKTAILELKMLLAVICRSFFFDSVPAELDTDDAVGVISIQPVQCYINPIPWTQVKM